MVELNSRIFAWTMFSRGKIIRKAAFEKNASNGGAGGGT